MISIKELENLPEEIQKGSIAVCRVFGGEKADCPPKGNSKKMDRCTRPWI